MEVGRDLFDETVLIRQWGRIGVSSRQRLDMFLDPGSAINALRALAETKQRRGYVETPRSL